MSERSFSIASLVSLTPAKREKLLSRLSDDDILELLYTWSAWARAEQLSPAGDWFVWLILAGRGWGKTKTGASWVNDQVEERGPVRIHLVGATAADVRDVMVGGVSGILASSHPKRRPHYEPSKRLVTWPNGATALCFSADEPERFRGPQCHLAWADELAAWRYAEESWDQLNFGLRLGTDPRCVVTTTPKPTKQVREIRDADDTHLTTGSTFANRANLAKPFLKRILKKYQGTRLGRQELYAEVLDDNPGALWKRKQIDLLRIKAKDMPRLVRIVVAIDPSVSATATSAECGIIAAGLGDDGHGYILEDESDILSAAAWATKGCDLFHKKKADRLVGEVNNGGDLVEVNVRTVDPDISYKAVRASRGKQTRAEPVSALYEQGRVHHVGSFPVLEDQLCDWDPTTGAPSPDRLDALVWAITELMLGDSGNDDGELIIIPNGRRAA